jgi:hypothetical protein
MNGKAYVATFAANSSTMFVKRERPFDLRLRGGIRTYQASELGLGSAGNEAGDV